MSMTGKQALVRGQALYRVLPRAGFNQGTFEELGRAAAVGRPWQRLSPELKVAIFQLVRDYGGQLRLIEIEEDVTAESIESAEAMAEAAAAEAEAATESAAAAVEAVAEVKAAAGVDDETDEDEDDDAPEDEGEDDEAVAAATVKAAPELPAPVPGTELHKSKKQRRREAKQAAEQAQKADETTPGASPPA